MRQLATPAQSTTQNDNYRASRSVQYGSGSYIGASSGKGRSHEFLSSEARFSPRHKHEITSAGETGSHYFGTFKPELWKSNGSLRSGPGNAPASCAGRRVMRPSENISSTPPRTGRDGRWLADGRTDGRAALKRMTPVGRPPSPPSPSPPLSVHTSCALLDFDWELRCPTPASQPAVGPSVRRTGHRVPRRSRTIDAITLSSARGSPLLLLLLLLVRNSSSSLSLASRFLSTDKFRRVPSRRATMLTTNRVDYTMCIMYSSFGKWFDANRTYRRTDVLFRFPPHFDSLVCFVELC